MASGAVERYLLEFNDALVAGAERRERILAEVEEHLCDATESLVAAGLPAGEAELEAVRRFGAPAQAAERFRPDPLGRGQQLSRWYEERRIAHPVLVPVLLYGPWIAFGAWWVSVGATWVIAMLMALQIYANCQARYAAGYEARSRAIGRATERLRVAMQGRWWITRALGWGAVAVYALVTLSATTTWFQVILGYYAACGAAAYCTRLTGCGDPACERCGRRDPAGHRAAAAGVRHAAWALALSGPLLLPQLVSATASHADSALFATAVFAALAAPPTRRSRRWLLRRRPAQRVAIRATPLQAMLVALAIQRPVLWILPLLGLLMVALVAARREIWCGRFRSDATRRHLVERANGVARDDEHEGEFARG